MEGNKATAAVCTVDINISRESTVTSQRGN